MPPLPFATTIVSAHDLAIFAAAALVMVLTPGPNMIYLVSRSLCQGRSAAFLSLLGVASGFLFHMLIATAGVTRSSLRFRMHTMFSGLGARRI